MKFTLAVKLPNNNKNSPMAKENSVEAFDPPAAMGGVKPLD